MTTPPPPDVSDPDPATAGAPPPRRDPIRRLHLLVELAVLGIAFLLLLRLAGLALPLVPGDDEINVSAAVPVEGPLDQQLPGLVPGVTLSSDDTTSVVIVDASPLQSTLALLAPLPSLAVYLVFFALLLRLVRTVRRLDPFTASSARRLRFLGGLLAGGALAASLAEMIIRAQLSATLTVSGVGYYSLDFPFSAVISGFGLVAVAEFLRRGGLMREELEGTV
ncbi:MAG: DUF2975 domain-containing protein [Actinomycetota bacterium]|nr:DUF2975 domain-containing protein [Actinomycetota bacterium]